MKFFKKGLIIGLVATSALTLGSCGNGETRNQVVPYGNLNDAVVASAQGYNVTQKQLYNRLKYAYGYTVFNKALNKVIYADEYANFKYEGEDKVTVDKAVANAVYGSDQISSLKTMTADDMADDRKRYIDTMANVGITVTENQIIFDTITDETEDVSFSNLPEDLILYYAEDIIIEDANIKYLETIVDQEELPSDDDENILVENTYYISDDTLKDEYTSYYMNYSTAHGIVLKFSSLEAANNLLTKVSFNTANLKQSYVDLYNAYYSYKTEPLTAEGLSENEDTTFLYDEDHSDLHDYSTNLYDFFVDVLNDGEGLTAPRNIDGSYYLVYREDLVYLTGTTETVEYDDLVATVGADETNKIKEILRTNLIEDSATAVESEVFNDRLVALELNIYDPFLENSFANSYSDYEYVTSSNNDYIFTTNETNYSVADFYKDLTNYNVNETLMTLLVNQYLFNQHYAYLDEDDESDLRDTINNNIKSFNNDETALNKLYGESNYLFYNYGYYSIDEIVLNNLASTIRSAYLADYVNTDWANNDHTINTEKLNALQNILDKALAIYGTEEYLDLNIDHILISVDYDGDGSPDDMDEFIAGLDTNQKAELSTEINNLANAILAECNAISYHTNLEKLQYIVTAFNRNYQTHDGKTWADYKTKFNFILTAESLGDVTASSVSNYVLPFQEFVEDLYAKVVADELDIPEKNNNGFFYSPNGEITTALNNALDLNAETQASDLCQTVYGFHLLSVNTYDEQTENVLNFKFTASNDSAGDYAEIRVVLEEDEDDEDNDIYVITDIYNDTEDTDVPSMNQVFVYYVEYTDGDVSSFRTALSNDLSDLLDDVIAKFQTSAFQSYILNTLFKDIAVNAELAGAFNYDTYMTYLMNQNESYDTESDYLDWYNYSSDTALNWSR